LAFCVVGAEVQEHEAKYQLETDLHHSIILSKETWKIESKLTKVIVGHAIARII